MLIGGVTDSQTNPSPTKKCDERTTLNDIVSVPYNQSPSQSQSLTQGISGSCTVRGQGCAIATSDCQNLDLGKNQRLVKVSSS